MKTSVKGFSCIIIALLLFSFLIENGFSKPPDELMGRDLDKAKRLYQRAIRGGDTSYTIHYAEALYYAGLYDQAYQIYEQADQAGLISKPSQKRNYVHVGRLVGKPVPYVQDTEYFSRNWDMQVKVSPFCANSSNEDFAPFVWNNILFITSSRQQEDIRYTFTHKPFLNIHAFIHDCIQIDIPDYLPSGLNTLMHDGPVTISSDGNMVIITRNYPDPTPEGVYNLYLDYYLKQNNVWSSKQLFPFVDAKYSVQHPFYNEEDSLLYFSSNIPGGYGGFDLYSSKWDGQQWQPPVNLGSEINTEYDEVFPSVSPQGYLIFSSNHIETTGGLDLVMYRDSIRYLFPKPFNTVYDDFSISFKDDRSGYFSSSRNPGVFNDDIYFFEIKEEPIPENEFYIEVLDKQTREPVSNVQVRFFSVSAQAQGLLLSDEQGMGFLHRGRQDKHEFAFDLYKSGYSSKSVTASDFMEKDGKYFLTLYMDADKLPVDKLGEEARLAGYFVVYFDNDHPNPGSNQPTTSFSYEQTFYSFMARKNDYYRYSSSSHTELNEFFLDVEKGMEQLRWLARFMQEELIAGRQYTIEFTSHASPLATSGYNLLLSKRRFASVENYFKSWVGGVLSGFIEKGMLNYANNPYGSTLARPGISDDRTDPARSIYGVEASRERKVTISWRLNDPQTGQIIPPPSQNRVPEFIPDSKNEPLETFKTSEETKLYHIIVGSFGNQTDAAAYTTSLRNKGFDSAIVLPQSDNSFRVSYKAFKTRQEAQDALHEIQNTIRPDAWVWKLER